VKYALNNRETGSGALNALAAGKRKKALNRLSGN
jgi:hypothetical protein